MTYAGAERVLEQILLLFPDSDLFSLVDFIPEGQRGFVLNKKTRTSFVQVLPSAKKKYRSYLPLMPYAVEGFDLSGYDLVISNSHAVAKGVKKKKNQVHICCCLTPMRYAWDLKDQYLREANLDRGLKKLLAEALLAYMRRWDLRTVPGVDHFAAISNYVAERVRRIYKRDSTVIYPPVDVEGFELGADKEDFYLTASRLVPYKRVNLTVEAFSKLPEKKLVVIGEGPDSEKIKLKAGRNVEFLGHQPADVLKGYMQRARAFVFAAEEDFGIAPVEAQACGTPVIAYGRGGVTETVVENKTGLFFKEQTPESLISAVQKFEKAGNGFDPHEISKNAERFNIDRFKREFREFVEKCLSSH